MAVDIMDRLGGGAGLLFVVFFFASAGMLPEGPSFEDATPDEIRAYYAQHENLLRLSILFGTVGLTLLLWFGAVLRSQLAHVERPQPTYATLSFAALALYAAFLILGLWLQNAAWGISGASDEALQSLHALRSVWDLAWEASRFFLVAFLASAGLLFVRTRVYPAWLGWIAIGLGVVFLVAAFDDVAPESLVNDLSFFISTLGFLAWIVATASLMAFRRSMGPANAQPVPSAND